MQVNLNVNVTYVTRTLYAIQCICLLGRSSRRSHETTKRNSREFFLSMKMISYFTIHKRHGVNL